MGERRSASGLRLGPPNDEFVYTWRRYFYLPEHVLKERIKSFRRHLLARQQAMPEEMRYRNWARLHAYYAIATKRGLSGWREYAWWCEDLPSWAIPGMGHRLVENPHENFWLRWPVVKDGVLYLCDALHERHESSDYYHTWMAAAGRRTQYLGAFSSIGEARRASGVRGQREYTRDMRSLPLADVPKENAA